MILVDVGVIDDMGEKPRAQAGHLGDHGNEHSVLREVEGHAKSHIAGALDEHAVQPAVGGDVPHGEEGAGLERHVRQVLHVPQGDHHAAALRVLLQGLQQVVHLMIFRKLVAVGLADGAVRPLPLVPDVAVPLLEHAHVVGLLLPDPEDLLHGGLEGHKFGGQDGKFLLQIELHDLVGQLVRGHARPVLAQRARIENALDDL